MEDLLFLLFIALIIFCLVAFFIKKTNPKEYKRLKGKFLKAIGRNKHPDDSKPKSGNNRKSRKDTTQKEIAHDSLSAEQVKRLIDEQTKSLKDSNDYLYKLLGDVETRCNRLEAELRQLKAGGTKPQPKPEPTPQLNPRTRAGQLFTTSLDRISPRPAFEDKLMSEEPGLHLFKITVASSNTARLDVADSSEARVRLLSAIQSMPPSLISASILSQTPSTIRTVSCGELVLTNGFWEVTKPISIQIL